MTIHIDYDREENKIQFLMASQTKMIRTLALTQYEPGIPSLHYNT